MLKTETYLNEIAEEISSIDEEKQKLKFLIDISSDIRLLNPHDYKPEYKVKGCISDTYIKAIKNPNDTISFLGNSDSLIIKGYLSILTNAFIEINTDEFLQNSKKQINSFLKKSQIHLNLTPSRANSFGATYNHMIKLASEI